MEFYDIPYAFSDSSGPTTGPVVATIVEAQLSGILFLSKSTNFDENKMLFSRASTTVVWTIH